MAQRIEARIGLRLPGKVEVLDGLAAGDRVVTAGQARLGRGEALPLRVVDITRPGGGGRRGAGQRAAPSGASAARGAVALSRARAMRISETSIRRPVFATVMSLMIVLIGLVSFDRLAVREYPRIDEPVVTVSTKLVGASSEVIESQVTKPLEDSIAGIDGVDIITSISRAEQSQITVRFKLEKNPDDAAADVRDRVSRVRARLPEAIDEPVIAKVEADATPTIWLAFTSDTLSPLQITDIINRIVKPRLQTVPGVANVQVNGDRLFAMRIWLDPDKLAAYRLTVQDVEDAIRKQNLEVPAGRIESQQREFSVTARTDLNTVPQFAEIALKPVNGYTVRLRDVARIEQAPASERSSVRLNGVPSISTGIIRNATANPLEISAAVREIMPQIQAELPPGMHGAGGQRQRGLHRPLGQVGVPHHRRGPGAGGAGGVRVPAHDARVDHPDGHHPGQPDRRLRHHGRWPASPSTR